MDKTEIEYFSGREVVVDVRCEDGRIIIFYGKITTCGPSGFIVDNGKESVLVRYDTVLKMRERGNARV